MKNLLKANQELVEEMAVLKQRIKELEQMVQRKNKFIPPSKEEDTRWAEKVSCTYHSGETQKACLTMKKRGNNVI